MNPSVLLGLESGLHGELAVLRRNRPRYLKEDANTPYEFVVEDAQLTQLHQTKQVLQEEVARKRKVLNARRRAIRELSKVRENQSAEEQRNARRRQDRTIGERLAELKLQVLKLRRDTLTFAKEQFPLSQDEDFEGGDFWDACVAACSVPGQPIEYSDREAGFAELLLQSGAVDRMEDLAGVKRVRLAPELYEIQEEEEPRVQ